jgi:dihydroorotase
MLALARSGRAAGEYDLLLKGGHLIDPKNGISDVRDVALLEGKVAAVAESIDPAMGFKVVDCRGLYVTPGLIDLHVHTFAGTNERGSYAGDLSLYPDGYTLRVGVTTVVDTGCSGWRNFELFRDAVIDRSQTRILAMLNIVGHGMRGGRYQQTLDDMQAAPTIEMAKKYPETVVGVKCAHYNGPEWLPVEEAVRAGDGAGVPVMIDFGANLPEARPIEVLLGEKLRPGDIYTHCFAGNRREILENGKPNPGFFAGRERGVYFDVGHGGGSFKWSVAEACLRAGFPPDSISTDLHTGSMNSGMLSQLNTMSKFLALGESLDDVIQQATSNPADEIKRDDLGHLTVGAIADVGIFSLAAGDFGFVDSFGGLQKGSRKLFCEMTLKDGQVVFDVNGRTREDWRHIEPLNYPRQGDSRWDGILHSRPRQ